MLEIILYLRFYNSLTPFQKQAYDNYNMLSCYYEKISKKYSMFSSNKINKLQRKNWKKWIFYVTFVSLLPTNQMCHASKILHIIIILQYHNNKNDPQLIPKDFKILDLLKKSHSLSGLEYKGTMNLQTPNQYPHSLIL